MHHIIEHIKVLLAVCNIDSHDMVIEYDSTQLLEDETDTSEALQPSEQAQEPLQEMPNQTLDVPTEPERPVSQTPLISSDSTDSLIKVVDYNNPEKCTHCKPVAFTFYHAKWEVTSWQKLYQRFLSVLYGQSKCRNILKNYIGKPLYGIKIDFTDSATKWYLRRPLEIAEDFYAEGNLSVIDIIRHIKASLELCNIDYHDMVIEYDTRISTEEKTDISKDIQPSEQAQEPLQENQNSSENTVFHPDTSKPFVLKDALVAILSSNDAKINRFRRRKGGLEPRILQGFIKEYYRKNVGMFEISSLLMKDADFTPIGRSYYILSPKTHTEEADTPAPQNIPLSEKIVEIIKQNLDNLQYEDGFGAYEIKNLLSHEGITNVSETEIEQIMAECDELTEVDEGYYTYQPKTQEISVEAQPEKEVPNPPQNDIIAPAVTESRYI